MNVSGKADFSDNHWKSQNTYENIGTGFLCLRRFVDNPRTVHWDPSTAADVAVEFEMHEKKRCGSASASVIDVIVIGL